MIFIICFNNMLGKDHLHLHRIFPIFSRINMRPCPLIGGIFNHPKSHFLIWKAFRSLRGSSIRKIMSNICLITGLLIILPLTIILPLAIIKIQHLKGYWTNWTSKINKIAYLVSMHQNIKLNIITKRHQAIKLNLAAKYQILNLNNN